MSHEERIKIGQDESSGGYPCVLYDILGLDYEAILLSDDPEAYSLSPEKRLQMLLDALRILIEESAVDVNYQPNEEKFLIHQLVSKPQKNICPDPRVPD